MRGTPNEFFSFLPNHERTAAIQAFAIIRRCDETLRFEALVGSWLVSRLITILRIDDSALKTEISTSTSMQSINPTSSAAIFNPEYSVPTGVTSVTSSSFPLNTDSDANTTSDNNYNFGTVPPGVEIPPIPPELQQQQPQLQKQSSSLAQAEKPEVIKSIEGNNINNNENNADGEAELVFDPDNPVPGEDISSSSSSKVNSKPVTTRRIIISSDKPLFMYIGHLQSSGAAMNGFATHLAGIISSFSTTKGTSTTVASTISYCLNLLEHSEHRDKLLNGLCSIIIHCHPSMQNVNADNEKALDDDSDGIIIPKKARVDLKRILTTALCCILLQVKTSCEAVQDFDYIWEACCDKGADLSSVFQASDRTSKECAWLLSIGSYLSQDLDSKNLTHSDRRKARLLFSGASVIMIGQSTMLLKQQPPGSVFAVEPPMKRQRLGKDLKNLFDKCRAVQMRKEKDAIAQICKIGRKFEKEASSNTVTGDQQHSFKQENQLDTTTKQTSILEIVMEAINDLSSTTIESSTIVEEFNKVAQVAAKMKFLHCGQDETFERDLISSIPLRSQFSTLHGRISSLESLGKFCQGLLVSTQNSYSPNGPSIFTGISFVDETLLVAESTTYVRLYLIEYNEHEETVAIEHVAANVRFYKSTSEQRFEPEPEDTEPLELLRVKQFMNQADMIDILDLNTWTEMLLEASSKRIKPSTKLLFYIGSCNKKNTHSSKQYTVGQIMIPVLNRALERLSKTGTNGHEEYLYLDPTGKMRANHRSDSSQISLQAKVIGRSMICLYYDAIESILDYETARLKTTSHGSLLLDLSFHKALLSICLICVVHATSGISTNFEQKKNGYGSQLFMQSILKLMDCSSYEYMKVSESFTQSLENSAKSLNKTLYKLPTLLLKKLQDAEVQLLECLLWSRNPNIDLERTIVGVLDYLISNQNKRSLWPPKVLKSNQDEEKLDDPDTPTYLDAYPQNSTTTNDLSFEVSYVDYLITKLLALVAKRVAVLCGHLNIPPHFQITRQVWYTFRQLLRKKIYLLYDRNVDHLILCTIYGICKAMRHKPEVTFSKIINVYDTCFEDRLDNLDSQKMIREVRLTSNDQRGTVIEFYNQIYLPAMKKYLLKSKNMTYNNQDQLSKLPGMIEGNWNSRQPGMMKLHESNFHLRIACGKTPLLRKECPRTRVLYAFGDASSTKSVRLINETINFC